jgi:hypothetical protein
MMRNCVVVGDHRIVCLEVVEYAVDGGLFCL